MTGAELAEERSRFLVNANGDGRGKGLTNVSSGDDWGDNGHALSVQAEVDKIDLYGTEYLLSVTDWC